MKRTGNSRDVQAGNWIGRVRPTLLLLATAGLLAANASAVTSGVSPYSGIVERNSFGLKPPVNPADLVKPPPPQTADIKLQGITTILGRKQVLMKIRVPAKPPEPARDQSVVLGEGMREGEVEVLEINPVEGTVKINNAGTVLPLNMKEHGEKPTPGAAPAPGGGIPAPGIPALPNLPPPVTPAAASTAPANSGMTVTTFGGTGNNNSESRSNPTLPSRALRTGAPGAAASGAGGLSALGNPQSAAQSSYQPPASPLSVDEQMAVLAVQHAAGQGGGLLPPLPAKYQVK